MHLNWKSIGDVEIIKASGRLDASSSNEIAKKLDDLIDDARLHLVVSLEELEYISSSGLRVLLAALKRVQQQKGDIRLAGLKTQVKEVFDLAGISSLFTITESEEEAVRSYKRLVRKEP